MRKVLFILVFILAIGFANPTKSFATEEPIRIDISQDTYAKEQIWYGHPFLSPSIYLGYDPTMTKHKRTRPYFKYDLAPLITSNLNIDEVESVTLNIFNWRPFYTGPFQIEVFAITGEWDQQYLDWSTQPAVDPDYQLIYLQGLPVLESIDITEFVKKQLTGVIPNNGIMLKMPNEYITGAWFWSLECEGIDYGEECDYQRKPHLLVNIKQDEVLLPPIPISPSNGAIITTNETDLIWEDDGDIGTVEKVEVSLSADFNTVIFQSEWGNISRYSLSGLDEGSYFWRTVRRISDEITSEVISDGFSFTIDLPEIIPPTPEPVPLPEPTPSPLPEPIQKPDSVQVPVPSEISSPVEVKPIETDIETKRAEVLGVKDLVKEIKCKFKYNVTKKEPTLINCNYPIPQIENLTHEIGGQKLYWINAFIKYAQTFEIELEKVKCKPFSIDDPATWFECKEEFIETVKKSAFLKNIFSAEIEKKNFIQYLTNLNNGQFVTLFGVNKDYASKSLKLKSFSSLSINLSEEIWLDLNFTSNQSQTVAIPKIEKKPTKPFDFMFKSAVGVTQWHGYTAFQNPHTGIDFGVNKVPIYAIADGVVEFAGWDSYYGECLSGGNVLRIRHANGTNSVYMHLDNYKTDAGVKLTLGSAVKRGQLIGLTGNSGAYNCQPLASHLHMEIRESKLQSTHKDPVSYLETDWSKILTIGASAIPGRLTGDNPHPGY